MNLELQGLPAVHQGWKVFREDMELDSRDDDHFSQVRFPVRIGEYQQFNDGLVGFWKESAGGAYEDGIFYSPQSESASDPQNPHAQG